ncbi:MAG: hypothetical protein M1825_004302 [Sarcosagium campestre]|nr:MAG: hypothetical protein M1825_004302 [Sarcosagium campestre]
MSAYHGPSVEDYQSDDNDLVPEIDTVLYKNERRRSHSSKSHRPPPAGDVASDSGYSSHAGATVASTSTSNDSRRGTPIDPTISPTRTRYSTSSNSPLKRRPQFFSSKTISTPHPAEEYAPARPKSQSRMRQSSEECHCADCIGPGNRVSASSPLETVWDGADAPLFQPERSYVGPPSPNNSRRYYEQIPMLATPHPRRLNAQPSRPARPSRPVSYHGGHGGLGRASHPEAQYISELYSWEREVGPPPAPSAYMNHTVPMAIPTRRSYATAAPTPPTIARPPLPPAPRPQMPASLPFADMRPPPQRWATEQYPARSMPRPTSLYGPPVVQYDQGPALAPPTRPSSRPSSTRDHGDVRTSISQKEEDFYRMRPPPIPSRRASMQPYYSQRETPLASPSSPPAAAERLPRTKTPKPQRSQSSTRRPSLSSNSSSRKSKSYTNGAAQVQVESGHHRRRSGIYDHDGVSDLERSAQAYQDEVGRNAPLTVDAVRRSKTPRRPGSDSGSQSQSRASSSRESSDVKQRRPPSGVAVTVPESDDSFTMRFASTAGVKLDFNGDFEGRTVRLTQAQGGDHAELSIRSRKIYPDPKSGAQIEYARNPRSRDSRSQTRDARSQTRSRRSSRVPGMRQPL